jgi:hypothetical protein
MLKRQRRRAHGRIDTEARAPRTSPLHRSWVLTERALGQSARGRSGRGATPLTVELRQWGRSALRRKDRRLSLSYYVREVQSGHQLSFEIWKITDDEAVRLGSQRGGLWHYRRLPRRRSGRPFVDWELGSDQMGRWQSTN